MDAIANYIMQAQSYASILLQSSDGMVSMAARMIEQSLKGIKEEMKNAHSCSECELIKPLQVQKPAPVAAAPAVEVAQPAPAKSSRMYKPRTTKYVFHYDFGLDDSRRYSREEIAELFQVPKVQMFNALSRWCMSVRPVKTKGKGGKLLYSANGVRKIRDILRTKYGYSEPPATLREEHENLPRNPSESSYEYEYVEKKVEEAEGIDSSNWPDAMPDCLKDED